jgi:hypothetical protein
MMYILDYHMRPISSSLPSEELQDGGDSGKEMNLRF